MNIYLYAICICAFLFVRLLIAKNYVNVYIYFKALSELEYKS